MKQGESFILHPGQLTLETIQLLLETKHPCILDSDCTNQIEASYQTVKNIIKDHKTVYGINTGFGALATQTISPEDLKQLQLNLVLSHACGTGELLADDVVALILLLKINSFAQGYSGVRLELIDALLALLNYRVYPCIPCKGSVGASGDLVPLAHMSLAILGVGEVRHQGEIISAKEGLQIAGIKPIELEAKEGIALLNGLQASTAIALNALFAAESLFETAMIAGALSVDAAQGSINPFDDRISAVRGNNAQRKVAGIFRDLLTNSEIGNALKEKKRVQDPYSLRCQPQIMGAVLHQMQFVNQTLAEEVNAVCDNPLVFSQAQEILSGGNFHGEIIAMAADNLALAIAEMGANSERRIALLIDENFSGLPAFLVKDSGLNSGFMIPHVTAAAAASDNKALAHPHCVDSIPTSANQEDHVSMATNAAYRLQAMIKNTATILAIELMAACQGLEFHKPLATSPKLQLIYDKLRAIVEPLDSDRLLAPDINLLKQMVLAGGFVQSKK